MILEKRTFYEGENEKSKVTIFENDKGSYTVFCKSLTNNKVKVMDCCGCSLQETINSASSVFKIPMAVE